MAESPEEGTLAHHLEHLAADADDVVALLTRSHSEEGDVHPEALGKSERLATSLKEVIKALGEHEPLEAGVGDVWRMLTRRHKERDIGVG